MERRVYLYGFGDLLKCVDHKFLKGDAITVRNLSRVAKQMREMNPECKIVWAVDNRPGLYREFLEAVKTKDFTKQVEFADTVSREGIPVVDIATLD